MRLYIFLVLAGMMFLNGCSSTPDLTEIPESSLEDRTAAQNKFIEGRQSLSLRMNSKALDSFQKAIELDPKNSVYYFYAGVIYFSEGQLDTAERYFKSAIQLEPRSKDAYRELGRLYMSKGMWEKAIHNFKRDIEISGTTFPHKVYNWLALSYYQLNQFENAEREWLKALSFRDNADIRYNLALAYKSRGELDKALNFFILATRLNSDLIFAHYEAGLLLLEKQRLPEAKEHFENVIRLEPKGELALIARINLNKMVEQ